jgi:hypothetical protein
MKVQVLKESSTYLADQVQRKVSNVIGGTAFLRERKTLYHGNLCFYILLLVLLGEIGNTRKVSTFFLFVVWSSTCHLRDIPERNFIIKLCFWKTFLS